MAKITSAEHHTKIAMAAFRDIKPPKNVPLDSSELPFFENVVAEFSRSEWTEHQLELAALLARNMAALEKAQREIKREGAVISNARGNPVQNPLLGYIRAMDSSILAHRRSLSLNASARPADKEDIARRRAHNRAIEDEILSHDDDLLARPN